MQYAAAPSQLRCFYLCLYHDTATTEIYTLSLHDALPISLAQQVVERQQVTQNVEMVVRVRDALRQDLAEAHRVHGRRSEEHTSELQSHSDLVCRLLLEKKKT